MENKPVAQEKKPEMITISRAEYDYLQKQNQWLLEQLLLLNKKTYGTLSERTTEEVHEQMRMLFNEAEVYVDEEKKAEAAVPAIEVRAHSRKRKSGNVRDILPDDIEVVEVEHTIPEDERTCTECGTVMEPIGTEVRETLELIPAKAVLHRDIYVSYACPKCKEESESTPVVQTPKEAAVIPGSYASPEAVAHVAVQKLVMGSPLYRQEQEWNAAGIMLSRQTMSNWLIRCADDWILPIREELQKQLVEKHDLLHADETEVQVLHEPGKAAQSKSYMWLYRTSGDAKHPIVLYDYQPGRGQEYPKSFLKGFKGRLQTDGYGGYNGLDDVIHIGCWAHARRKFEEARQAVPKGKRSSTAEEGVAYCTKLFKLEEAFRNLSPEERKQKRLEQAKPVLDAMKVWAETRHAAPKSKLGIALNYLLNQWSTLIAYLEDGRIELSNNRAERSIKPFVIARKNFLFANTPSGARSTAAFFSLIETAKEEGLDPYRYLVWVFKEAPRRFNKDTAWASSLLPQNAPDDCRIHTDH